MEIWEIFRNLVTQCLPTLQTRRSPIPVPTHQAPMDGWMLLPFNLCEFALLLGYFQMGPGIWEVSVVPSITFLAVSVQRVFLGLCSDGEGICWNLTMALLFGAAL